MAMLFITASLMNCGDSAAGHRGTIPVPVMMAAALMLRLVACCSGVLPGVAVRLRSVPKSSNSSIIVTPEITNRYLLVERGVPPASSYLQRVIPGNARFVMGVNFAMRYWLSPATSLPEYKGQLTHPGSRGQRGPNIGEVMSATDRFAALQ
jgi:hypothetical protein